jgi:hypothetical protein
MLLEQIVDLRISRWGAAILTTMLRSLVSRRLWLCAAVGAALTACHNPPDDSSAQAVEQRLVGTWLREYEEEGVKVRRVLVLESGGRFIEMSRITELDASATEHSHTGDWLFDGTNLKRRYTSVDGRQPAAPVMPYATFELKFPSRNEFVGIDRVRRREVQYRRVADGTTP